MAIRVAIADDQPLIRSGLRTMLDHAADLDLVGEAADGEQAVALAQRARPDVLLMDIRMPVLDKSRPRGVSPPTPISTGCGW